ncbi:MAG: Ig-like domain-containing protein [Myxococcota bacterium]
MHRTIGITLLAIACSGGTATDTDSGVDTDTDTDTDTDAAAVVSVAIDPADLGSIAPGATATATATATYDDGTTADVTADADWTSSDDAVATVATGVVTGVAAGAATITAAYDGQQGDATLAVSGGVFDALVEGDWSPQHGGQSQTFFARLVDEDDGTIVACGSVTEESAIWSMSFPGVLIADHRYHAEAFADINKDGEANDPGHMYFSVTKKKVAEDQTFDVPHAGPAPDWSGVGCP